MSAAPLCKGCGKPMRLKRIAARAPGAPRYRAECRKRCSVCGSCGAPVRFKDTPDEMLCAGCRDDWEHLKGFVGLPGLRLPFFGCTQGCAICGLCFQPLDNAERTRA